jgi:HNH endonuclease
MSQSRQHASRSTRIRGDTAANTRYGSPYTLPDNLSPEKKKEIRAFWLRVDCSGDCWIWGGSRTGYGYGKYRKQLAHRYAHSVTKRPVAGFVIRHSCDNPLCFRPDHLLAGTHADNARDRVARGRARGGRKKGEHGELNSNLRISAAQAQAALDLWANGKYSQAQIGRLTGMSPGRVRSIATGTTWAHLEPAPYEVPDRVVAAISRTFVTMGLAMVSLGNIEGLFRELVHIVLERRMKEGLRPSGPKPSRQPGVIPPERDPRTHVAT